ncbi:hypothetical protein ACX9NE_10410 [Mycobacterium sp. ML4]
MDQREQARLIASLTDDELAELTERAKHLPPEEGDDADPDRQFIRALTASAHQRGWMADLAGRFGSDGDDTTDTGDAGGRDAPPDGEKDNAVAFLRTITDRANQPRRNTAAFLRVINPDQPR